MNLDKSTKRIDKKVKKGFQGYPEIIISYFGKNTDMATKVIVGFKAEENAEVLTEQFVTVDDIKIDTTVQSTIVKIIERSGAKTVTLTDGVEQE